LDFNLSTMSAIKLAICLAAGVFILSFTVIHTEEIPFPEGYLQWKYIKSDTNSRGGIHHIYANLIALEGYRTGVFPNGSCLVFDVFDVVKKDSSLIAGGRRAVDIMIKDSSKYASTGGWGYEEFRGDSRTERNLKGGVAVCYNCHARKKDHDFVFSTFTQSTMSLH